MFLFLGQTSSTPLKFTKEPTPMKDHIAVTNAVIAATILPT